jgi:hypothetical protein
MTKCSVGDHEEDKTSPLTGGLVPVLGIFVLVGDLVEHLWGELVTIWGDFVLVGDMVELPLGDLVPARIS